MLFFFCYCIDRNSFNATCRLKIIIMYIQSIVRWVQRDIAHSFRLITHFFFYKVKLIVLAYPNVLIIKTKGKNGFVFINFYMRTFSWLRRIISESIRLYIKNTERILFYGI